ncbi:cytochrome P450 [Mycena maculata]|uniref:Cytochrome P450 n=1 Tax=Mycena maculata TaxID=230809 RepID=A0AAD7P1C2_9AGAR|nr:cytochrome P450 [Mycena maculata]
MVQVCPGSPFEALTVSMAAGNAIPSFAADDLEKLKRSDAPPPDMEEVIKNCAGIAYLTGSDTTASVILAWFLAMVLNPDIQAKARAEIDAVLGNRLPEFSDLPSLPYAKAMLDETLRWAPITPLAGNAYAIVHDGRTPQVYTQTFHPPGRQGALRPETVAFGFGRSICPGRYLALNSAWIAMVPIPKTYIIDNLKAVDQDSKCIVPQVDFTTGVVSWWNTESVNMSLTR